MSRLAALAALAALAGAGGAAADADLSQKIEIAECYAPASGLELAPGNILGDTEGPDARGRSTNFWVKLLNPTPPGQWRAIFHKGSFEANPIHERNPAAWLRPGDNRVHFVSAKNGVENPFQDTASQLTAGEWTMVTQTHAPDGESKLYFHANLEGTRDAGGPPNNNLNPFYGYSREPDYLQAEVLVAKLTAYPGVLSHGQIQDLHYSEHVDLDLCTGDEPIEPGCDTQERGANCASSSASADTEGTCVGLSFDCDADSATCDGSD